MGLDQIPCLSDMPLDAECVVRSHLGLSADSNKDRHTEHANGEYSYRLGNGYRSHFGLAPTAQAKRHLHSLGSWLAGSGGSPPRAACLSPDPAILARRLFTLEHGLEVHQDGDVWYVYRKPSGRGRTQKPPLLQWHWE